MVPWSNSVTVYYSSFLKIQIIALTILAQLLECVIPQSKDHQFDSWSGYMTGLWAQSPVGGCSRGTD